MCSGNVNVDAGWLGSGGSTAISAARYSPVGIRLILAPSSAAGCQVEESGFSDQFIGTLGAAPQGTVVITLAPDVVPGTYVLPSSSQVRVVGEYTSPGATSYQPLVSGTLVLSAVSPTQGLAGSYHLDFGTARAGGTTSATSATSTSTSSTGSSGATSGGTSSGGTSTGTTSAPFQGELIEEGTFIAPICELCSSPPACMPDLDGGGAPCPGDQVCNMGCTAPPICTGAPSCAACGLPGGGEGENCSYFDGFSASYYVVF